jgi:hypothetical protein
MGLHHSVIECLMQRLQATGMMNVSYLAGRQNYT